MANATALKTYDIAGGVGGSGNHEDLMDVVVNISKEDTPMLSNFAKDTANDVRVSWLQDKLAAPKLNKKLEGDVTAYTKRPARVRVSNTCQILESEVEVSRTQRKVNPAGIADEFNYQVEQSTKEHATDIEYSLVNGIEEVGDESTAREMNGVLEFIKTNAVDATGAALTEDAYVDLLQDVWYAGGKPTVTHVNADQKRAMDAFTTPNQRYLDGAMGNLSNYVSSYQSSFGIQKLFLNRFIPADTLLALEEGKWKVSVLDPTHYEDRAKTSDSDKGVVISELTLKAMHEAANGKIEGLATATS